jgi:hypothetical protein
VGHARCLGRDDGRWGKGYAEGMSIREHALEFVRRFAAGDIDGLAALLTADLRLTGPNLQVTSSAAYLQALRRDPPAPGRATVLSVTDDDDTVAVFWEYEKPAGRLTIAQLFRFRDQHICEMQLVFDRGSGD